MERECDPEKLARLYCKIYEHPNDEIYESLLKLAGVIAMNCNAALSLGDAAALEEICLEVSSIFDDPDEWVNSADWISAQDQSDLNAFVLELLDAFDVRQAVCRALSEMPNGPRENAGGDLNYLFDKPGSFWQWWEFAHPLLEGTAPD